ncbi:MAG TPA: flavin reductase family protein [Acidimicrobiales bacterium]|nr:flavin reductase family protein [Acidimicrobiales bacterium]
MATPGIPVGPFPPGVDHDAYDRMRRRLLWKLPMGLYVLGSRSGDRRNLMTINWAMQVSTQPKHVAVSIEAAAVTHRLVSEGGCFSLSLLSRLQRAEVRKFVKPAVHDAAAGTLAGVAFKEEITGAPIPEIAIAWLDCALRRQLAVGSHTLFVGEVVAAGFADGGEDAPVLRMEDTRMSYGG